MIYLPAYLFVIDSVSYVSSTGVYEDYSLPASFPLRDTTQTRHPVSSSGSSLTDTAFSAASYGDLNGSRSLSNHPVEASRIPVS